MGLLVGPSLLPVTVEEIRAREHHLYLHLHLYLYLYLLHLLRRLSVPMGLMDIVLVINVVVNMDGVEPLPHFVALGARLAHVLVALLLLLPCLHLLLLR